MVVEPDSRNRGRFGNSLPDLTPKLSDTEEEARMASDSLEFYRRHAQRYSELSHGFIHSAYTECSHPALKTDMDLLNQVVELTSGRSGLDAGCGAGARDVHLLHSWGFDMYGIDAVAENIEVAKELHPEISERLEVADLQEPLRFADASFDLVLCNAVIQHIAPSVTESVTLPELVRVLRTGGVLQLMFKAGTGLETVVDRAYGDEGIDRSFELYDEHELLELLKGRGCTLVEADSDASLGGLMYFKDPKPMRYCVFWVRKS